MDKIINVQQVINQIQNYRGAANNITTVVGITEDCSKKSENQGDFSKCMMTSLIATCMKDPYYQKPKFPFMSKNKSYKPNTGGRSNRGGQPNKGGRRNRGGRPNKGGNRNRGGRRNRGGFSRKTKQQCEPCIPLKAKNEVSTVWKTCMDEPKAQDFYHKFLKCLNWEPKGDRPLKDMWPQLFTPRFQISIFFDQASQDAHTNCMYHKLGLGNTTVVNAQGFKNMVHHKLIGEKKAKDDLIATIDACSSGTAAITSEKFTACTLQSLKTKCGQ